MGYTIWALFVVVRILLCLWPMNGYIHPDEFFQNTEPLAGDIIGLNVVRTWDFNSTRPIRSVFFPYITSGLTMKVLQYADAVGIMPLSPYTLLVFPRLMMAMLSLLCIDYPIYTICKLLEMKAEICLTIFASSYVTLVYYTRTFSNSYETMAFSLLLLLVVDSRLDQFKSTPSKNTEGRPNHAFWIGVFIVEATFNRVTFPCFALIPFIFWLTGSAFEFGVHAIREVTSNCLALLPGCLTMLVSNVLIDSIYYGTLDSAVLTNPQLLYRSLNFDLLFKNVTVTPLNCLLYNLDMHNLARHGFNSRITHALFNLPMLCLPLVICFVSEVFSLVRGRFQTTSTGFAGSSSRAFFALCFVTPLFLVSIVPHHEPRFIVPLLVPLVLLYAEFVMSGAFIPNVPWIIWNVLGCIMFGFVHQGGVIPSIMHTHSLVSQPAQTPIQYHFVYYHTYMPPRHLALYNQSVSSVLSVNKPTLKPGELSNTMTIHDLMGADRLVLSSTVNNLLSSKHTPVPRLFKKEVYVFAPASLDPVFCRLGVKHNFKLVKSFFPHISMEDLPEFMPAYTCVAEPHRSFRNQKSLQKWQTMFSLNMYKAEMVQIVPHIEDPVM
ncbi:GPI mannosyltransferase 4-like [Acanthaster planci]|uniref:Mannosyltransferase n=1 Tax=Acanthaster planci TaxID=133434 RepID=A0A8B7YZC1_ACAPL|nr:GPI mannosyltransferase 4-like [Acanthaster planci]XP_022098041.1 GPI mannosyltransferase 4-like [Acanthaster planci]XP_022098042.1 GPI mannosyltransferase 4-like [Acanthaster planci]XP_022098043.1 GPI mannosyltransferase 4-like [Acanthaster planci]XP_022098044.1 GPI mannosyltransferase 4-like [Acanthaster planci]XP_022098045.1 GPI mannosyltransferase 4-like [Acanthaster planci]